MIDGAKDRTRLISDDQSGGQGSVNIAQSAVPKQPHELYNIYSKITIITMNPEYSEEYEQKPLPLKLIEGWDTEEEIQSKKKFEALVNGDVTLRDAAIDSTRLLCMKPTGERKNF